MKPIETSILLHSLRENSLHLLNRIKGLSEQFPAEYLTINDGPGRWNIIQVLEHLNSYYRYYLPIMESKIGSGNTHPDPLFQPGWLGNYFTKMMAPVNGVVKSKMKAMKAHSPQIDLDSDAVIGEFLAWQRKLIALIGLSANVSLNSIRIPISISPFIRLKLGDTFRFIVAHNQRHLLQVEKILAGFQHAPA